MILELQSTTSRVDLDDLDEKGLRLLINNSKQILADDGYESIGIRPMDTDSIDEMTDTSDLIVLQQDAEYIIKTIETHYPEYLI